MSDLAEFLAARLDEAKAGAWAVHDVAKCDALLYEEDMADAARRDPDCDCGYPARVLREVEFARAILRVHGLKAEKVYQPPYDSCTGERLPDVYEVTCYECGYAGDDPATSACATLRALAAIWSDHPDYDPGWAL